MKRETVTPLDHLYLKLDQSHLLDQNGLWYALYQSNERWPMGPTDTIMRNNRGTCALNTQQKRHAA